MNFQPKLKEVEMKNMVKNICAAMVISLCAAGHLFATENNPNNDNKFMEENLNLIQEWDKTFPQSDKVNHKKITFHNRYGITLAADLYVPKNVTGKLPAIAISGPFGAVKEQASGLYAQTLAERGFLTIAFDPSYTGESSGQPRYVASPDINTEDFSAAVDYLSTRDDVDAERIGILGICGWGGMAPFSWMGYIVISRKDLEENGREILIHELAHIHNRHSWDLLVADVCIFFQWFNPASWLLKQELQNIHEFEADETVIKEGVDAKQYQLLLIKKAVGTRLYSMANSFNHSKLKKRITMMLKEKSSPWARLKYLYVLPVAAIAVTAFARPEVSETVEEISAVKVNDLTAIVETKVAESSGQLLPVQSVPKDSVNRKSKVAVQQMDELVVVGYASKDSVKDREPVFNVVEQMPSFPGGMEALMQYLAKNMRYPVEAQKNKVQGRVVVGFIVSKDGDIKKAHILRGVDPELDAEAIRVIESMPRWMPGMQRGKAIAVSYTLPVMFRLTGDALGLKLVEASGSTAGELDKGVTFSYAEGKQPLCIVNGKKVDWAVMRALNPDRIKSITVLKDKAILEEKYGEKGQNGVLLITLKGYTE